MDKPGTVYSINGPIVVAEDIEGAIMFELVRVGNAKLVGEVIKMEYNLATIQVYESTKGLSIGEPVQRTGKPLCIALGPGLLNCAFDGIQRPLQLTNSMFVPHGMEVAPLDMNKMFAFEPTTVVTVGDKVSGGDVIGSVEETVLLKDHKILVPPIEMGEITYLAPAGDYSLKDKVLELEFDGKKQSYTMMHYWPVRMPRPEAEKLSSHQPLITGSRVTDLMFPLVQGGKCAIPGPYGTGKTMIFQSLTKFSNADVVVYVGCGERGNEMSSLLTDTSFLTLPYQGTNVSVMNRTSLVVNTSDMPVAAREACIYSGVTIAQYYRDMGLNVVLMADSTSRWAEALREIALSTMDAPVETILTGRLSGFYERAGRVRCLGSSTRYGSLTILGSISPPGGDCSNDPVTTASLSMVNTMWLFDVKMARKRHFPSISYEYSFTQKPSQFDDYFDTIDPDLSANRSTALQILHREVELQDTIREVGKDSLEDEDKLTIIVAGLISTIILQQNAFSQWDMYCPMYKTAWMLKNILFYHEKAKSALQMGKIKYHKLHEQSEPMYTKLFNQKYTIPSQGKDAVTAQLKQVKQFIIDEFVRILYG